MPKTSLNQKICLSLLNQLAKRKTRKVTIVSSKNYSIVVDEKNAKLASLVLNYYNNLENYEKQKTPLFKKAICLATLSLCLFLKSSNYEEEKLDILTATDLDYEEIINESQRIVEDIVSESTFTEKESNLSRENQTSSNNNHKENTGINNQIEQVFLNYNFEEVTFKTTNNFSIQEGIHVTYENPTYSIKIEELKKISFVMDREGGFDNYDEALGIISVMFNRLDEGIFKKTLDSNSEVVTNLVEVITAEGQFSTWDETEYEKSSYSKNIEAINPTILQAIYDACNGKRNNDYLYFNNKQKGETGTITNNGNVYTGLAKNLKRTNNQYRRILTKY